MMDAEQEYRDTLGLEPAGRDVRVGRMIEPVDCDPARRIRVGTHALLTAYRLSKTMPYPDRPTTDWKRSTTRMVIGYTAHTA